MRNLLLSCIAILLLMIIGCKNNDSHEVDQQQLIQAFRKAYDTNLEKSNPDSALRLADAILKQAKVNTYADVVVDAIILKGIVADAEGKYDSAIMFFEDAENIAKNKSLLSRVAHALYMKGSSLMEKEKYDQAINEIKKAKEINLQISSTDQLAANFSLLATIFGYQNLVDSSLVYDQKAFEIFKQSGNIGNAAIVLGNIALIQKENGMMSKATHNRKLANSILDSLKDYYNLSTGLNSLGLIYLNVEKYDSARLCFEDAITKSKKAHYKIMELISTFNLGRTFHKLGKHKQSLAIMDSTFRICEYMNMTDGLLRVYHQKATIYTDIGKYDLAEAQLKKGLELAKENNYPNFEQGMSFDMARVYLQRSNEPEAVYYLERYRTLLDSINESSSKNKILELQTRYETKIKDREINLLIQKDALKTAHVRLLLLLTILLIFIIAFVLVFLRKRNLLLQKEKKLVEEQNKQQKTELEKSHLETRLNEESLKNKELIIRQKDQELVFNALNRAKSIAFFHRLKDQILPFSMRIKTKNDQKEFQKIIYQMEAANNVNAMDEFEKIFKELHPEFFSKLFDKHPKLTNRESQICAMIKLNMNTWDIASVTFLEPSSINTIRYRIRKKMNLNSDDSLYHELILLK